VDLSDTVRDQIRQAVTIIREGGLVAFPTETYYGLAVDPFNEKALERLFALKQRSSVKPVLLLIPAINDLVSLAETIPAMAYILMDRFWPGPLTMVFPARRELSQLLTGGTGTIGIRLSPHPVAHALLQAYGGPLTATSANRSGGDAAATEDDVLGIFGDEIDMILQGGRTTGTMPSTLIGFEKDTVFCIREGCIPFNKILTTLQVEDGPSARHQNEH